MEGRGAHLYRDKQQISTDAGQDAEVLQVVVQMGSAVTSTSTSLLQRYRVPQHAASPAHHSPIVFQILCTLVTFFRSAEVSSDSNNVSINTISEPPFRQIPDILPRASEWS